MMNNTMKVATHKLLGYHMGTGAATCSCGWVAYGCFSAEEARYEHRYHMQDVRPPVNTAHRRADRASFFRAVRNG
jgi:hypothetical protein